ncbi:hypothetical protein BJV74DRAFT_844994, partial [Russula compacta]
MSSRDHGGIGIEQHESQSDKICLLQNLRSPYFIQSCKVPDEAGQRLAIPASSAIRTPICARLGERCNGRIARVWQYAVVAADNEWKFLQRLYSYSTHSHRLSALASRESVIRIWEK